MILLCLFMSLFLKSQVYSRDNANLPGKKNSGKMTMEQATMCEGIKGLLPFNETIVFSITKGKVFCFTSFDSVSKRSSIYHSWFNRDDLSTRIRLYLKPPRWSTYSSIKLREADRGPWRVEITDNKGTLLHVLRFSVTD